MLDTVEAAVGRALKKSDCDPGQIAGFVTALAQELEAFSRSNPRKLSIRQNVALSVTSQILTTVSLCLRRLSGEAAHDHHH